MKPRENSNPVRISIFFFILKPKDAMCVICHKLVSGFKKYDIKRQYETMHREKIGKDHPLESRVRGAWLAELKKQITTQQSLLTKVKGSSSTTDASFAVAQIIGECIKEAALAT